MVRRTLPSGCPSDLLSSRRLQRSMEAGLDVDPHHDAPFDVCPSGIDDPFKRGRAGLRNETRAGYAEANVAANASSWSASAVRAADLMTGPSNRTGPHIR
jgi:hypothetical protein